MITQGETQAKQAALEEISRLNVLLSELLEQTGRDHQSRIWVQIMGRIPPSCLSEAQALAYHSEETR